MSLYDTFISGREDTLLLNYTKEVQYSSASRHAMILVNVGVLPTSIIIALISRFRRERGLRECGVSWVRTSLLWMTRISA